MRFALICGDETPADLRELIANLRDKQRRSQIPSIRDELNADINEALDLLKACATEEVLLDGCCGVATD